MRLIRCVCIIKLLYERFFDISINYFIIIFNISSNAKSSSTHKLVSPLRTVFEPQRIISKFIYLSSPPLHVCFHQSFIKIGIFEFARFPCSKSPNAPEVKRHERCLQAPDSSLLGYERQEENGGRRL